MTTPKSLEISSQDFGLHTEKIFQQLVSDTLGN